MMIQESSFIEVGRFQVSKAGEFAPGDTIVSKKCHETGRLVTVLSDGLGSGIKAGVLSSLTATMALKTIENRVSETRVAETICNTLPVCSQRKISYATFTIADIEHNVAKITEYDNPSYIHLRGESICNWTKTVRSFKGNLDRTRLYFSKFHVFPGDRIIFYSDGVYQSGLGSRVYPLGYGEDVKKFILNEIINDEEISANDLAKKIVYKAIGNDIGKPKDDISCVVIYLRKPRTALLVTGPPVEHKKDYLVSAKLRDFLGQKIICGGTTANIISREWGRNIRVPLKDIDLSMPPMGEMDGIDLVTEGIITLGKVSEFLEHGIPRGVTSKNPGVQIVNLLLNRDKIKFLVGTKINDAHQDPNMPVELEIRRNIVKKISSLLKEKYLKETEIEFI